jgi:CheY-like chemotaxis protein
VLRIEGYEVLTASNGREALACLEESEVDLVVLDVMMAVMDGRVLCKHIGADAAYGSIPVVLMSATHFLMQLDGCRPAAIIRKPFGTERLLHVVVVALGE